MRRFLKDTHNTPSKVLVTESKVLRRESKEGKPQEIVLESGSVPGTCLNCPDTPCVYFHEEEIVSPILKSFSFNRTREVCPIGALSVDPARPLPIINEQACVGCGLCISRCPTGAIYCKNNGVVALNDAENSMFKARKINDERSFEKTVAKLSHTPRSGSIRRIDEKTLETVMTSLFAAKLTNTSQKLLARNLLICLGAKAAISTVGDTNVRIDMWWESDGFLWVTEVDFDIVSLVDSPRGLLDDVAVCVSRHGVAKNKIGAMILNMEFPNKRSDYYHLIEDIKNTTMLKIRTLPIAALLLALWTHRNIWAIDLSKCVATLNAENTASCLSSFITDTGILRSRYFCATK
jgi:Fe-S-cluster-containing hydrogenase component 2